MRLRLFTGQIMQPFGKEKRRIAVQHGGPGKYLGVSRPSQALISLRTVCGDIKEIIPLPPLDIAYKLVYQRMGTAEISGLLHIGMHCTGGEVL